MPNDNRQVATRDQQAPAQQQSGQLTVGQRADKLGAMLLNRREQIEGLLGDKADFDKFKQVVVMAVTRTPELLDCTPASMMNACLACASDGLVCDGKQAALTKFGNEACYMPMRDGIILCLNRTGLIQDIQTDCVYRGEKFENISGTNPRLEHEPSLERGGDDQITGAYVVIRTINGGFYKLAMGRSRIDKAKAVAKTKNVWNSWYDQMAIKTVIRNISKILPKELQLPVLTRDDAMYDLSAKPIENKVHRLQHDPRNEVKKLDAPVEPVGSAVEAKQPEPAPRPAQEQKAAPEAPMSDIAAIDAPDPNVDEVPVEIHPLVTWGIGKLARAAFFDDLVPIMEKLWSHPTWDEIHESGEYRKLYDLILTTPAWKSASVKEQESETYKRIANNG